MSQIASWFALAVRPRYEKTTARILRLKGLEPFSPVYRQRRRWSDRIREVEVELFPGYVFCRFSFSERLMALGTPGIISSVGRVEEREIEVIRAVVASGLPAQPWPYLRAGQRVRIEEGCLQGVVGIVLRQKDVCRVVVNVELLQRSVAVEIDRGLVRPLAA